MDAIIDIASPGEPYDLTAHWFNGDRYWVYDNVHDTYHS